MYQMFHQANAFNQDIGRWKLKVVARLNIQDTLVTLLTFQSPMYWLKEGVL
jgi:hypothetical protein